MDRVPHSPYDAVFKHLLPHRATAKGSLDIHLPGPLCALCNLNTLQLESGDFTDDKLRVSYSDILHSLQMQAGEGYIYLLIEHQSSTDRYMAFRPMCYTIAAMQRHLDKGHTQLPLATPLLFYHGRISPWPYPMCRLTGFADPDVARWIYGDDFPSIDIITTPDGEIMRHRRAAMSELLQKHIRQRDMMDPHEQLVSLLVLGYTSRRQLKMLLHHLLQAGNAADPAIFLRHLVQGVPRRLHKETFMSIAQPLEQCSRQQGSRQGLQQDLRQGLE